MKRRVLIHELYTSRTDADCFDNQMNVVFLDGDRSVAADSAAFVLFQMGAYPRRVRSRGYSLDVLVDPEYRVQANMVEALILARAQKRLCGFGKVRFYFSKGEYDAAADTRIDKRLAEIEAEKKSLREKYNQLQEEAQKLNEKKEMER